MRRLIHFSMLSFSLLAAGCVGGYQPGTSGSTDPGTPGTPGTTTTTPGQAPNAEALFVNNVQGFISTECASCHAIDRQQAGPKFLGSDGTYYANLVTDPRMVNNKPDQSYLILHKHIAGPGMGSDPVMAQQQSIIAWITQENLERTLPAPPQSMMIPTDAIMGFAACMTYTDYQSSGMDQIWKTQTNGNTGQCNSCHQNGEHNVSLGVDPQTNFTKLSDLRDQLRLAVANVQADGTCSDVIEANRFWQRGAEPGHPQFNGTNIQTAENSFFKLTYARWKAGNCTSSSSPDGGTADGGP